MPLTRKRIRVGDVLTLKSGSKPMTAIYVGRVVFAPGVWVTCQWWDENGDVQQELFPQTALVHAAHARQGARRDERERARPVTLLGRLASAVRRWLALRAAPRSA
jgi:uncharacterized protein YodC (DUF2158 family)